MKVKVSGPHEGNLTIVNVPGVFQTKMEETAKNNICLVKDITTGYIRDKRTVILVMIPSNVGDVAQETLELAKGYDPLGQRTLRILTKPDPVLDIECQNKACGLPALQEQPYILLREIDIREFLKLSRDVNTMRQECQREWDSTGPSRKEEREQRSYLRRIAEAFQSHVRAALSADYNADPIFSHDSLRLISHIVNITNVFRSDFEQGAHSREFQAFGCLDQAETLSEFEDDIQVDSDKETIDILQEQLEQMGLDDITPDEQREIGDIVSTPHRTFTPRGEILTWIKNIYLKSRGQDLGTFNANVVASAFYEQSSRWGEMTKVYMGRVIIIIHRFISTVLRSLLPDDQTHSQLWRAILNDLRRSYLKAIEQAMLLIELERCKPPYTVNRQFVDSIEGARGRRTKELLRPKARKDAKSGCESRYRVDMDDDSEATEHKHHTEFLYQTIHDTLHAYYKIAMDRFIDNIFQLAVGHHLLTGPHSPLKVFNQEWVINLEPKFLQRIAGEAKAV